MVKTILLAIAFIVAVVAIQYLKRHGKTTECSELDYLYGNRFKIYHQGNVFFIYDREFRTDINVYNKRMSFSSRKEAEEFLLEFGDLFACLENEN